MPPMLAKKASKELLRALMAEHALTGNEVARILKVRPQTVRCYMCGTRPIRAQQLERVQKHVGDTP